MHIYTIHSGSFNLAIATAKTALQLVTGATRRAKLLEFGVALPSVTPSDAPVLAELLDQTSAGTSTAFTPLPIDPADPAAIQTARNTVTAEPTGNTAIAIPPLLVPAQGGLFVYRWDLGEEYLVPISKRVGLRLTSPAALTGCYAWLKYQE